MNAIILLRNPFDFVIVCSSLSKCSLQRLQAGKILPTYILLNYIIKPPYLSSEFYKYYIKYKKRTPRFAASRLDSSYLLCFFIFLFDGSDYEIGPRTDASEKQNAYNEEHIREIESVIRLAVIVVRYR